MSETTTIIVENSSGFSDGDIIKIDDVNPICVRQCHG